MHPKSFQSCPTLHDFMHYSPPGSSVHGLLQARILEWVVMLSSRGSSQPRDQPCIFYVSCIGRWIPGSSWGKESAYNAGDPGSIPGSGRSAGKGIGYPPEYSWASLVSQLVKNPPAMRETWVGKIPWRRDRLPTPVFCPGEFRGLCSPWVAKSRTGYLYTAVFGHHGWKSRIPFL